MIGRMRQMAWHRTFRVTTTKRRAPCYVRPMGRTTLFVALLMAWAVLFSGGNARAGDSPKFVALDGDTIELAGRVIDLAGIDAPEFGQLCRRGDVEVDCGMVARTQLLDLTAGSEVTCDLDNAEIRTGWPTVAVCRVGGYDLSEGMLHTGWALTTQNDALSERYGRVATTSRQSGRGLWGFEFVKPWAWRRGERLGATAAQ